jgi:hypothetical protein
MTVVDRGSYKVEVFLRKLAKHLTLDGTTKWVAGDNCWYLGGGYWRARPVHEDTGGIRLLTGVTLINPSKSAEDIEAVAKAMNVLI